MFAAVGQSLMVLVSKRLTCIEVGLLLHGSRVELGLLPKILQCWEEPDRGAGATLKQ